MTFPKAPTLRRSAAVEPLEYRTFFSVVAGGFAESVVGNGLRQPTAMTAGPNLEDGIYIAEKAGRVRLYRGGTLAPNPVLNLVVDLSGDRGLLGIAVGPYFARDKSVFLAYTTGGGEPHLRVSTVLASGDNVLASSERPVLDLPVWDAASFGDGLSNVGGTLRVAGDGTVFLGLGDLGKKENASNLDSPFGKILRFKPDGGVPADNPFASASGWKRYVWAYGLHDPTGIAFQPQSGIVHVNDAGPVGAAAASAVEEVNLGLPGADYGWPAGQGIATGRAPLYVMPHDLGANPDPDSIAGGHVTGGVFLVTGSRAFPLPFAGDYFFADETAGVIRVMDYTKFRRGDVEVFATGVPSPIDLVATASGDLMALSLGADGVGVDAVGRGTGQLLRYVANGSPAVVRNPKGGSAVAGGTFTMSVEAAGLAPFYYQWQRDGVDIPGATAQTYATPVLSVADSGSAYRVIVSNDKGSAYSRSATVLVTASGTGTGTGGEDPGTGGNGGTGTGGNNGGGTGFPSPFPPTKPTRPQGPFDLLPQFASIAKPTAIAGAAARVMVRVFNLGLDVSPTVLHVRLYLSTDGVLDSGDVAAADYVKSARIRGGGGSKSIKVRFAYPDEAAGGTYQLLADVLTGDPTYESNVLNDWAAGGGTVRVDAPAVDLTAKVPLTRDVPIGGTVKLPVTVFNDGNVAGAGDISIVVSVIAGTDPANMDGQIGATTIASATAVYTRVVRVAVPPGKGKTVKLKFEMPTDVTAGAYTLVASVDTTNAIAESNEANNTGVAFGTFLVQ